MARPGTPRGKEDAVCNLRSHGPLRQTWRHQKVRTPAPSCLWTTGPWVSASHKQDEDRGPHLTQRLESGLGGLGRSHPDYRTLLRRRQWSLSCPFSSPEIIPSITHSHGKWGGKGLWDPAVQLSPCFSAPSMPPALTVWSQPPGPPLLSIPELSCQNAGLGELMGELGELWKLGLVST